MLQSVEAAALADRRRREGVVVPDYEGYCVANVPGTAGTVLDVDVGQSGPTEVDRRALPRDVFDGVETDVSHMAVVVLDSLGWHRWRRDAADHPFLARLAERGTMTPLTSVASASTAPAITSIHTGVPPAEHGLLGCDAFLPDHGVVVNPFTHEVRPDTADREGTDGPTPSPVSADRIVAAEQVYPTFEAAGVETTVVQPAATVGTPYAGATVSEATTRPYESHAEGAAALRQAVADARGPSYTYWYASALDAATHEYGPDSGAYHDALASITRHLSRELYDRLDARGAAETLLVVTADHGSIPTPPGPEGCLDLREIDAVTANLRSDGTDGGQGDTGRLPPYGDPRVCHLPVEPGAESAVVAALETRGVTAFTREQARDLELFGPADAPAWTGRCGDVIAVPSERKLLYPGMEKVAAFAGTHGGLTDREMVVPFAAARLSRLQS